ncbi:MAG: hypothetical protein BJ554DRAFT_2966, partial [Olpidium bornovanus]
MSPTRRLPAKGKNAAEVPVMAAGSTTPPYSPHATMEATMELYSGTSKPQQSRGEDDTRALKWPEERQPGSTALHRTEPSPRSPKHSVLLQGEKEKAKQEAEGKDAENATLKRQVEALQRQLADHRATIEELAIEQHAEDQNYAGTRASDLLAQTMLAAVPTYNGTGGATALTNFIAKVETAAEQAELNEGQTLALAIHRLSGQASILWLSHVKEHSKESHQRWTSWRDLREALSMRFFPMEHLETTMTTLLTLTQVKCEDDLEEYVETFNTLFMQLPSP